MTMHELAKEFAQELGEEYKENALVSYEQYEAQVINRYESGLKTLLEDFTEGLQAIYDCLEEAKVSAHAENVVLPSLEELKNRLSNLSNKPIDNEEAVLQELLEISDEALSVMFVAAHLLKSKGASNLAVKAFQALTLLLPQIGDFWIGLGASLEMQGSKEDALDAYRAATILEPSNPVGYQQAALMAYELNQKDVAREIIQTAKAFALKSRNAVFEREISNVEEIL